jgi:hypothetical protein
MVKLKKNLLLFFIIFFFMLIIIFKTVRFEIKEKNLIRFKKDNKKFVIHVSREYSPIAHYGGVGSVLGSITKGQIKKGYKSWV